MTTFTADIERKERLDTYIAKQFPAISRSFLQKLCAGDQVLVNGVPQKSGYRISPGDTVEVLYDMAAIDEIEPIELPVLFEDDDILVINKPTGVISHARGRFWNEPSVASFIRQRSEQTGERAGIVHRLDRATSGVMICAKNDKSMAYLQKQFADRSVIKTYRAVIEGHIQPPKAVIDMPIERNPKAPATFRVGPNGKTAQTIYEVIAGGKDCELVELLPKTGRTHQLRVHLKHLGHPIIGDSLYGGRGYSRLMLHAASLKLRLPSGDEVAFEAPLPAEFESMIRGGI